MHKFSINQKFRKELKILYENFDQIYFFDSRKTKNVIQIRIVEILFFFFKFV